MVGGRVSFGTLLIVISCRVVFPSSAFSINSVPLHCIAWHMHQQQQASSVHDGIMDYITAFSLKSSLGRRGGGKDHRKEMNTSETGKRRVCQKAVGITGYPLASLSLEPSI
jgi:hypothetical protein